MGSMTFTRHMAADGAERIEVDEWLDEIEVTPELLAVAAGTTVDVRITFRTFSETATYEVIGGIGDRHTLRFVCKRVEEPS